MRLAAPWTRSRKRDQEPGRTARKRRRSGVQPALVPRLVPFSPTSGTRRLIALQPDKEIIDSVATNDLEGGLAACGSRDQGQWDRRSESFRPLVMFRVVQSWVRAMDLHKEVLGQARARFSL
jgi:hypothetical protein